MIQAMKSLEDLQKSNAAKTLSWGQELKLTKEGLDLMPEETRPEKIFSNLSSTLDAEKQDVESLLELGRMTVRVPSEVVMIDDAEATSGSAEPEASKPKEMMPPPKKPETKKAPFPPGGKPAIKKEKEKKEEKIKMPEQKKMPKAPAAEEKE